MSTAMTKIDWLTFGINTAAPFGDGSDKTFDLVLSLIESAIGEIWTPVIRCGEWQVEQGRGVYHSSRVNTESKIRVSFGDVNSHIHVECSGQSCEIIRGKGVFYEIFQQETVRCSRIDFACDFETDTSVDEIIVKGYKATYKSRTDIRTVDGDTTYVGSRKSERMLRVYRYHEPHPRAKVIRFEVEIKGDTAKAIAPQITEASCHLLCLGAVKVFGLKHELIADATAEVSKLPSRPYDKAKNGRMRWLMTQVLPALVKAHLEGDIDARVWCETFLFPAVE